MECNANFLPCYTYVSEEKLFCRPSRDHYFITETVAVVPLQPLAVHTIDWILEIPRVKKVVLEMKEETGIVSLLLKEKVGNDT